MILVEYLFLHHAPIFPLLGLSEILQRISVTVSNCTQYIPPTKGSLPMYSLMVNTTKFHPVSKPQIPKSFFVLLFCLCRVAPAAYGGSQARRQIRAVAAGLCQSQAASVTYATAHGNTGSLTH